MRLKRLWAGLALLYAIFIIYGTSYPFMLPGWQDFLAKFTFRSFTLLFTRPSEILVSDNIQNLLFFLPFGYFLGKYVGGRRPWPGLFTAAILSFLLSSTVEYIQIYMPHRHTSYVDIISNVLSGLMGALGARFIRVPKFMAGQKRVFRQIFQTRWSLPALALAFMVLLEALQPFNFTLTVNQFPVKTDLFFSITPNLQFLMLLGRYGLIFAMGTAVFTAWLYENKIRHHLLWALVIYVLYGFFLETTQFIILSRLPGILEYASILIGCSTGVIIFKYMPQRRLVIVFLFWVTTGFICAQIFSSALPGNMDLARILPLYDTPMVTSPNALWTSIIISHLTLFIFIGFALAYLGFRFRSAPGSTLVNLAGYLVSLLISIKYTTQFSPFGNEIRYFFPIIGMGLGCLLCYWSYKCYRDYYRYHST